MATWAAFGVIGVAVWSAAAPAAAAAQTVGWTSLSSDGTCFASATLGNGTTLFKRSSSPRPGSIVSDGGTAVLKRLANGSWDLSFSFHEEGTIETKDLKAEIKQDNFSREDTPSHKIYLASMVSEHKEKLSDSHYTSFVAFRIEAGDPFLDWVEGNDPGYAINRNGSVLGEFRFPDLAEARRIVAACAAAGGPVSRPVTPRHDPQGWFDFTGKRYVSEASRSFTVAARLTVGTDGRVKGCTVTASTGSADEDRILCQGLERRGRFMPATNSRGDPVAATYLYEATIGAD